MKYLLWLLIGAMLAPNPNAHAQNRINAFIDAEYKAGHFNGSALVVQGGNVVAKLNRGYANMQFAVPITDSTRFPIASLTTVFTAILVLQLVEKSQLRLDDSISRFVPDLPDDCRNITLSQLLMHESDLQNERMEAHSFPLCATEDFNQRFVRRMPKYAVKGDFNFNALDYILLTQVLQARTGEAYRTLLQERIFGPLHMANSGVMVDDSIIPKLAYGYHSYAYGHSAHDFPLNSDVLPYLPSYSGAGAIYSTTADMYKLVQALRANVLLTSATTRKFLSRPQRATHPKYIRSYPTLGLYYNNETFEQPVLESIGGINGFNSMVLTDTDFRSVVILLTNTNTANLEVMGDKIYAELR